MSFTLLSPTIQKYVYDQGWAKLRAIQDAAIIRIMGNDNHYIIASRTASGKTEAAFLPILSKVDFNETGVQVLYISPLIALINDQFFRIEALCKYLEVRVTKWHGEAKKSLKTNLIKDPSGIVLITPESIEAMFVNAPYTVSALFGNLKYIVIDEIHAFLGVDRGLQLMSLLWRLQEVNKSKISIIGLSATIGNENYDQAKRLVGDIKNTKVLLDKTIIPAQAKFKFFKSTPTSFSLDLLKDLYKETYHSKALIFPNSRGKSEEVAVKLRKISDRVNGHTHYFSHHSSVDREIREGIEHFAKNNERFYFCISCTSTLELGIDLGTINKVVQIDSTYSVASLVQRMGRSGRGEGQNSIVNIYATNKWSLLQSLACWNLYKEGYLETIHTAEKPFDILLHQLLSIVKERSGCTPRELKMRIEHNPTFHKITKMEVSDAIAAFLELDYIERIGDELILGIAGEEIVNSREFYSVFQSELNFKVVNLGNKIGDIPLSPQVKIDENVLLAAKIWKIVDIDYKGTKIFVIPANDGKKPIFSGSGGEIDARIRQEMLRVLICNEKYEELDAFSGTVIAELRRDFKDFPIKDLTYDRPLIVKENGVLLYTFTGTKINISLQFLFSLTDTDTELNDKNSSFELSLNTTDLSVLIDNVNAIYTRIDHYLMDTLKENTALIEFSKWGRYLPLIYQVQIIKERYFDFKGALDLMNNLRIRM